MRQRSTLMLVVACLAVTAACGGGEKAKVTGAEVVVRDVSFRPVTISVKLGSEVTWTFEDKATSHNVTADDGSFRSPNLAKGSFVHRFEKAGSVSYVCTIHPGMEGTLTVG